MRLLLAIALTLILAPAGDAISLRRQCRLECRDAISACVAAGGKRARCRRQLLRRCRRHGLAVCVPAGLPATSTTTAPTTTTTLGSGTSTTTTLPAVNVCNQAASADLRNRSPITVQFASYSYDPPCLIVSPGTVVTFSGDFAFHPLRGGRVIGETQNPDPSSPFEPGTSTGVSTSFTLSEAGTFPFYCDAHGVIGMSGAVYVVP